MPIGRRAALALPAALALGARAAGAAPVEKVRLGLLHTLSPAPFYLAEQNGFWKAEGVDVGFRFFQAAEPIAAAAVAGDIDVGVTALTGGFFSLAGKGTMAVIGGALHEKKGVPLTAVVASTKAYAAGLTDIARLPGHSFAITQYGSSFEYMMARLAQYYHFDPKSVTLRPLQSIGNMVAAVRTGQVDATMAIASIARPLIDSGAVKLLGWVGDEVPYQITALFATRAMIDKRAEALHRFCKGYQQGIALYRKAFLTFGPDGKPVYGPETDAAIKQITQYVFTGDPNAAAKIKSGIGWYDVGGALDVADVTAQLKWYEAHGMVKGNIDPKAVIDTRFLPTL